MLIDAAELFVAGAEAIDPLTFIALGAVIGGVGGGALYMIIEDREMTSLPKFLSSLFVVIMTLGCLGMFAEIKHEGRDASWSEIVMMFGIGIALLAGIPYIMRRR